MEVGIMIKIDAIINEDKMEDVKDALQELQVHGMTISQVMGCGTQMGYKEKVRGYDVDINLLPKVKFQPGVGEADRGCDLPHGAHRRTRRRQDLRIRADGRCPHPYRGTRTEGRVGG